MRRARGPILLGGYDAKRCAMRVHNDHNPLVPRPDREPSPEDRARMAAGRAFESDTVGLLTALHPGAVLIDPGLRAADAVGMTLAAMDDRAPLILGGWLPDDEDGGRKGKPDILIRVPGGYLPADVKHHGTLKQTGKTTAVVSPLAEPAARVTVTGWSSASGKRFDDGIQLAHYTRMLQACGRHGGPNLGAILGTTPLALAGDGSDHPVLVWYDLDEPLFTTFSRSRGKARRSLLERYDHEHGFRVRVARNARMMTGAAGDPPALVDPIGQEECLRCPYQQWCADQLGPDDPSMLITIGRLDVREWVTLRAMGVTTTAALSAVDPDDEEFFAEYAAELPGGGTAGTRTKLAQAVRRAKMISEGIEIARTGTGPVDLPVAEVEIDLDVELDRNNRVYMWGVRIRSGSDDSTAKYLDDFVDWEVLDADRERELAERFVAWLRMTAERRNVRVYHWSHPEASNLRRILGPAAVADLTGRIFVDLDQVFRANFFSLHGSKLKVVAPIFGFRWSVPDPGGETSQLYLDVVHAGGDDGAAAEARRWLSSYNGDDAAATAVVRDGMRAWDG